MSYKQIPKRGLSAKAFPLHANGSDDAECNRFLLYDGTVRWVREGAVLPFADRLLMAGRNARYEVYYRVDEAGVLHTAATGCHYTLTTRQNAPFCDTFTADVALLGAQGALSEVVDHVDIKGVLSVATHTAQGLRIRRVWYPAVQSVGLVQRITVCNEATADATVWLDCDESEVVDVSACPFAVCKAVAPADETGKMLCALPQDTRRDIPPQGTATWWVVYYARRQSADVMVDCRLEWKKRQETVAECFSQTLSIHTPEPLFDALFAHAYLAAVEQIADTPAGCLMLSEGHSMAALAHTASFWRCAGNYRADLAMQNTLSAIPTPIQGDVPLFFNYASQACGAATPTQWGCWLAQYALSCGAEGAARWLDAVALSVRQVLAKVKDGVYYGLKKPDLQTQCEGYRLLVLATQVAFAADDLPKAQQWQENAHTMRQAIDQVFGACVQGCQTYAVGKGKHLAAPIYLPLTMGVDERAESTALALTGCLYDGVDTLWYDAKGKQYREQDLLGTAYALFQCGYADAAVEMMRNYAQCRLLGPHAPYPVPSPYESFGHHGALGALLAHTLLSGLLGLQWQGDSVQLCLHIPTQWRYLQVNGLRLGAQVVRLDWRDDHLTVSDLFGKRLYDGAAHRNRTVVLPFM